MHDERKKNIISSSGIYHGIRYSKKEEGNGREREIGNAIRAYVHRSGEKKRGVGGGVMFEWWDVDSKGRAGGDVNVDVKE